MPISHAELTEKFQTFSDEELLSRWQAGTLTELAQLVAREESVRRGVTLPDLATPNPEIPADAGHAAIDHGPYETVARFATTTEAHVVRAHLESEGIPAILVDEHLIGTNLLMSTAFGYARVQVPADLMAQSKELMAAMRAGDFTLPEENAGSNVSATDGTTDLTEALLAYAQDPYYPRAWARRITGTGNYAGFNFYAAMFGATWCFSRKMYLAGAGIFIAGIGAVSIGQLIIESSPALSTASDTALLWLQLLGVFLLVRIPTGLFGNIWYFRKAQKAIQALEALPIPREQQLRKLKARGGISIGAVLVSLVLTAGYRLMTGMV